MTIHKHSHFGVYAVIKRNDDTEILLIKKARGPYTGKYDLSGGSMEESELLEGTLIREVKEETGCDIEKYHQIGGVSALYPYTKDGHVSELRHVGVLYRADITGDPMTTGDGEDSHGCVWINVNELTSDNATPFVLLSV